MLASIKFRSKILIGRAKRYIHHLKYLLNISKIKHLIANKNVPHLDDIFRSFCIVTESRFTEEETRQFKSLVEYHDSLKVSTQEIDYSLFRQGMKRTVSEIASTAASPFTWCKLYYALTKEIGAGRVLEVGTNLGVSGQYYLKALENNKRYSALFVTMEGISGLCEISKRRFKELTEESKIEYSIVEGLYDETIDIVRNRYKEFDIVFIDGNHYYSPTIKYFESLKATYSNTAVIIFDDINFRKEMQLAWNKIKEDPEVVYSIDLFRLGIVLYQRNYKKRNNEAKYELFLSLK